MPFQFWLSCNFHLVEYTLNACFQQQTLCCGQLCVLGQLRVPAYFGQLHVPNTVNYVLRISYMFPTRSIVCSQPVQSCVPKSITCSQPVKLRVSFSKVYFLCEEIYLNKYISIYRTSWYLTCNTCTVCLSIQSTGSENLRWCVWSLPAYPLMIDAGTIETQSPYPFAIIQIMKLINDKLIVYLWPRNLIIRGGTKIQEITIVISLILAQIVPIPVWKYIKLSFL